MNKKTAALIIISLILFLATTAGVFWGVYSLTKSIARNYPEIISEDESYRGLTKENLESLSDEELEYEIINDIWYSQIGEDSENEYEQVKKLPQSQKSLYATWTFETEFYDGGFVQFFYYYQGQFAQEAMEGYQFFSAPKHAALMAEAIEIYEKEQELYQNAVDKGSTVAFTSLYKQSELADLDEEFDAIGDEATELRINYIREHIDEFVSEQ